MAPIAGRRRSDGKRAGAPVPVRAELVDCLIVAAAQGQNCAVLLTEDLQDGARYDDLVVRNPFALDVHEPIPDYPVEPAHAHPRRGRPRKSANAQTRP